MRNSFDEDDIFDNKDEQSDRSKYHASYTLQRYNFWNSNSFIWDFILISFRHYGSPGGLHKTMHDDFLRPDSYYLEHATLLIESFEQIIDIFIYCVNRNDNLREARKLELSIPMDNTNRTDMDVVMDDTNVPGALSAQESSSLRDLTLSYTEVQIHDKDTTSETNIRKWYFAAMGMNNLYIPEYHAPNTWQR